MSARSERRRRRLAMAALLAAGSVALIGPRAWAAAPQGGFTSPGEDEVVATPTVVVAGQFSQPSNAFGEGDVEQIDLVLRRPEAADNEPPPPDDWAQRFTGTDDTLPFEWTTPALAYNGAYTVTATARGRDASPTGDQPETTTVARTFRLAVLPAPPAGVATSTNDATGQVAISWRPNREPDLVGYQVHRAPGGSSRWSEVATTATTSAVDEPPVGEWRYRVFAVRRGATASELLSSAPSAAVTAEVKPPPTTTAGDSSGGDGATGSGSTSGGAGAGGSTGTTVAGSAPAPAVAQTGRVDFSSFAELLDQARSRSTPAPRAEAPDPGFQETLPFRPGEPPDALVDEETNDEAGADEDANVVTRLITDESERRRSLSYIAGAIVCFVLLMLFRWLKKEAELIPLEQLDPDEASRPAGAPPRRTLAERRAAATMVAAAHETPSRRPNARRASRRVPSRPANDRGQGPAPVRPRRRRTGPGDRRAPVR